MRTVNAALLALGCWWLAGAQAQEQDAEEQTSPELDFLEYLGAWAEEDDEWLAIEEWQKDDADAAAPEKDPEGSEREEEDDDESE